MTIATVNLRNRIEASKKAPGYNERTFVDAPTHELEAMLKERDALLASLKECVRELATDDPEAQVGYGVIDRARAAITHAEGRAGIHTPITSKVATIKRRKSWPPWARWYAVDRADADCGGTCLFTTKPHHERVDGMLTGRWTANEAPAWVRGPRLSTDWTRTLRRIVE